MPLYWYILYLCVCVHWSATEVKGMEIFEMEMPRLISYQSVDHVQLTRKVLKMKPKINSNEVLSRLNLTDHLLD